MEFLKKYYFLQYWSVHLLEGNNNLKELQKEESIKISWEVGTQITQTIGFESSSIANIKKKHRDINVTCWSLLFHVLFEIDNGRIYFTKWYLVIQIHLKKVENHCIVHFHPILSMSLVCWHL